MLRFCLGAAGSRNGHGGYVWPNRGRTSQEMDQRVARNSNDYGAMPSDSSLPPGSNGSASKSKGPVSRSKGTASKSKWSASRSKGEKREKIYRFTTQIMVSPRSGEGQTASRERTRKLCHNGEILVFFIALWDCPLSFCPLTCRQTLSTWSQIPLAPKVASKRHEQDENFGVRTQFWVLSLLACWPRLI